MKTTYLVTRKSILFCWSVIILVALCYFASLSNACNRDLYGSLCNQVDGAAGLRSFGGDGTFDANDDDMEVLVDANGTLYMADSNGNQIEIIMDSREVNLTGENWSCLVNEPRVITGSRLSVQSETIQLRAWGFEQAIKLTRGKP